MVVQETWSLKGTKEHGLNGVLLECIKLYAEALGPIFVGLGSCLKETVLALEKCRLYSSVAGEVTRFQAPGWDCT